VLHVGLAGAQRSSGIGVGDLVVGSEAVYDDLVTSTPLAPVLVAGDPRLVGAAARVLDVEPVRIGTSGRIGGVTSGCPVEAMEGFAVLRACQLAGVPAIEVRAISNRVDDPRSDWRLGDGLEALQGALPRLLEGVAAALRPGM
jgi:futalosine hydrolase